MGFKKAKNHPFIVWDACILWIISILAILWSLLLFFGVGQELFLTGTDLVNAFVLLSGIIMLPTHLSIVYAIAKGEIVDPSTKVLWRCRLRCCVIWIIIINVMGVIFCLQRMYYCYAITLKYISKSMKLYRTTPKHKRFIDNLQWSLGCCGLHSYKDWFTQDWHDKVRDYEWSLPNARNAKAVSDLEETDSVPSSCCKSGAGVSCYLDELGTNSINTEGCGDMMYRIIMISMSVHITLFLIVIVLEVLLLKYTKKNEKKNPATPKSKPQICRPKCKYYKSITKPIKKPIKKPKCKNKCCASCRRVNIRNIMSINDNFELSSGSYRFNAEEPEDSEEIHTISHSQDDNDEN
ncbi:RDS/peripherin-like protein xRDS35 [Pararge aegeria]|uniref:RDS/peripherin-like protein xRDS35 n=1 Tax=Pararge aegeria TaxID=116150 RepID=UPI0019D02758|nr:RDS/peripherin-like protein xRDS35 [Pararge aegeria]